MRNALAAVSIAAGLSLPALCDVGVGILQVGPFAFDRWGRLKKYPSYTKKSCPRPDRVGAVIFLIGQSNAANFAVVDSASAPSVSPTREKLDFFQDADCFSSPQIAPALGGTGLGHHLWNWLEFPAGSPYAAKSAVLSVFSVHGMKLSFFLDQRALPAMLREFNLLNSRFPVTDIFLLQGESDFLGNTPAEAYLAQLKAMIERFRAQGFKGHFWLNATTRCQSNLRPWFKDNEIARTQKTAASRLAVNGDVRFALDIDELISDATRADGCHFNGAGLKFLGKKIGDVLAQAQP